MSNSQQQTQPSEGLDDYLDHYGLNADPFAADSPFIDIGDRQQQLDLLLHVARYSHMLACLIGPEDSGKSRSLLHIEAQQRGAHHFIVLAAHSLQNSEALLMDAIAQFGVNAQGYQCDQLVSLLRIQQAEISDADLPIFLLIDDAQHLDPDTLSALLKLCAEEGEGKPVPVVIAGTEPLEDSLLVLVNRGDLTERVHFAHLNELSPDDSDQFIRLSFAAVNHSAEVIPFSDDDLELIHQQANGRLGAVKRAAQDALLEGIVAPFVPQRSSFPLLHLSAIVAIVTMLLAAWLLWPSAATQPEAVTESNNSATLSAMQGALRQQLGQPDAANSEEVTHPFAEPSDPIQNLVEAKSPQSSINEDQSLPAQTKKTVQPDSAKPAATANISSSVSKTAAPKPASIESLMANNPNAFCIQLLGTREASRAKEFIAAYERRLDGPFSYYLTSFKGQSWYVVVYGNFPNRQTALEALQNLPVELRRQQPWIRNFKSIRSVLTNNS